MLHRGMFGAVRMAIEQVTVDTVFFRRLFVLVFIELQTRSCGHDGSSTRSACRGCRWQGPF
jgi:hypothetical protein